MLLSRRPTNGEPEQGADTGIEHMGIVNTKEVEKVSVQLLGPRAGMGYSLEPSTEVFELGQGPWSTPTNGKLHRFVRHSKPLFQGIFLSESRIDLKRVATDKDYEGMAVKGRACVGCIEILRV